MCANGLQPPGIWMDLLPCPHASSSEQSAWGGGGWRAGQIRLAQPAVVGVFLDQIISPSLPPGSASGEGGLVLPG